MFAHIDKARDQLVLLRVDNGEGMNGDQDFISLTMNTDEVVEVFVLIVRSELDIDVFSDARRNHALFVVLYLEIGC